MKKREPKPLIMDEPGTYYVGGKYIVAPANVVEKSLEELTSALPPKDDKKTRKPKPKRK